MLDFIFSHAKTVIGVLLSGLGFDPFYRQSCITAAPCVLMFPQAGPLSPLLEAELGWRGVLLGGSGESFLAACHHGSGLWVAGICPSG